MAVVRQIGSAEATSSGSGLRLVTDRPAEQAGSSSGVESNDSFLTPDQLFSMLDGRTLVTSAGQFTIEVFGVLHEAGCQWAQIALTGPGLRRMLTVRVKPGASVQRAILMLSSWLAFPADYQDIVHVA
jgi:hypothetical protein